MFVVEIDYVVYTYYVKELRVTSNVKRQLDNVVEYKLKRVDIILTSELDLTLTDYEDYIDCTEDEESNISLIFFFLMNEFDYVYIKCNVSNISIT